MADTYTAELAIRLIATGAYSATWGAVQSNDQFTLLTKSIAGLGTFVLTTGTYSLPALTNGGASDSRMAALRFSGSPGSTCTVTLPGTVTKKLYFVINNADQSIILTYGSGLTTTIIAGQKQMVFCDSAVGVVALGGATLDATTFAGHALADFALLAGNQTFTKGQAIQFVSLTNASTIAVDASLSNYFKITLDGSYTLGNPTGLLDGQTIEIHLRQDGTGGRTLAYGSKWRWPGNISPVITATANHLDVIVATYRSDLDILVASIVQDFVP